VSDGALGGQPSDAAAWQAAPAQGIPQPASADDPQQARIAGDGSPGAPPATGRPGQGQQGGQGQEHRGRRRRRRHHGHGGQRPPGTQGPQA
jgi:hypothetical protein